MKKKSPNSQNGHNMWDPRNLTTKTPTRFGCQEKKIIPIFFGFFPKIWQFDQNKNWFGYKNTGEDHGFSQIEKKCANKKVIQKIALKKLEKARKSCFLTIFTREMDIFWIFFRQSEYFG